MSESFRICGVPIHDRLILEDGTRIPLIMYNKEKLYGGFTPKYVVHTDPAKFIEIQFADGGYAYIGGRQRLVLFDAFINGEHEEVFTDKISIGETVLGIDKDFNPIGRFISCIRIPLYDTKLVFFNTRENYYIDTHDGNALCVSEEQK